MIEAIAQHFIAGGEETCGFVLASGEVVAVKNHAQDPKMDFEVSDEDLTRYEPEAVATWHTHPVTSCNLTVTDYACFLVFPQLSHYIFDGTRLAKYVVDAGYVILEEIQTI